jgi:prepilin-type N-terminal cleavage/methylation domain-containing protein
LETGATQAGGIAKSRRRGMTLVEVLLTLTLLVVIGSFVAPVLINSFPTARLRQGGDQVLARWSDARAKAIETGVVHQFVFTPESGEFRVEPWGGAVEDNRIGAAPKASPTAPSTAAKPTEPAAVGASALPENVTFHDGQIAVDDAASGERRVDSLKSSANEPAMPILFFPDGTTSSASIVLQNEKRQYVRLTLRSLTGTGRSTGVLTSEELARGQR